ncbi:hypothetical protein MNBD_DELTA01-1458 [hydrothermal vent metagenome]|uniref:DUF302 domain-containing protein n=1 Tax=hydrothermal vent metagenome TaxID=652676 RepID=A0A3B0REZ3_9ZZZZ
MSDLGMSKKLDCDYEEAIEKVKAALAPEGFGVLTEIDVKATLKKKLDKDFRRYIILGACNPQYAYKALSKELNIGVFMPCNVIVYENDGGGSTVTAVDPTVSIGSVGDADICEVAGEVRKLLKSIVEGL